LLSAKNRVHSARFFRWQFTNFIYFLNPSYIVTSPDGTPLLRLTKKPAVFESRFVLEKLSEFSEDDELRSLLALVMVVLLERKRG